ncbi:MAG TPA: carbon-nitrogen hydrolase family protein, partial [Candidatus Baltobacteraceae bacterium]|nr:carbon-nitrogen hydrolase family protein [Candidatus Baltobacteraceae bacterium]
TIVVGTAMRRNGVLYNSAVAIDRDGTIAGSADKAFLWHFDRKWFTPAEEIAPVRTSIGTLGLLVCADGRMPGIARALVDRGAEILVMPTAWVTSGRNPHALENIQADLLARVRAFENGVPFVAANKCGVERGMVAYCGKSQIISADGTVLALADERAPGVVSAEVTMTVARPHRHARLHVPETAGHSHPRPVRIAISIEPLPDDIDERLELLDVEVAIAPDVPYGTRYINAVAPTITIDAQAIFDPGALPPMRTTGIRIVVIDAHKSHPWLERVARTRALELRLYAIVLDREAKRAYAIDPDGAIVAGTFGDYALASFSLDARRTAETSVAPGTDIAAGIERVETLVQRRTPL